MNLKYHQETFELLSLKPKIYEERLEQLNEVEDKYNISIPASVKELYSIKQAIEIFKTHSCYDCYCDIHTPKEWFKNNQIWYDYYDQAPYKNLLNEGLLLFLSVNQEVSEHLVIKLDGSEDPPVFIEFDSFPNFYWQLYANFFSEFIYQMVWEFLRYPKEIRLSAYTSILTQQMLLTLGKYFLPSPEFIDPVDKKVYRFRRYFQGIRITIEYKCAKWELSATSSSSLLNLASQIWELGFHLKYISTKDEKSTIVLNQLKLSGKLKEEVSSDEEYMQECLSKEFLDLYSTCSQFEPPMFRATK